MSSFSAKFTVDGTDYDVRSCIFSFAQATDERGRPASTVHAGTISLQIVVSEENGLIEWMVDPYKKTNGSITYQRIDQDSTLKELQFEDGYCVGYSESFHSTSAEPMVASLNISARKISVGDVTHEVTW
jgi:hypothetical protein